MAGEIQFQAFESEQQSGSSATADLGRLGEVPVELAVEIGRTQMTIGETLGLGPGAIVALNRLAGEPVDLLVNGKRIARGEVVVIDEEFGLRITEVVSVARRLSDAQAAEEPPVVPEPPAHAPATEAGEPAPAHPPDPSLGGIDVLPDPFAVEPGPGDDDEELRL